MIMFSSWKRF